MRSDIEYAVGDTVPAIARKPALTLEDLDVIEESFAEERSSTRAAAYIVLAALLGLVAAVTAALTLAGPT